MEKLRARVINGRLVMDEPTELPEGIVLDLVIDDEGDDLTPEERAALHAAIAVAWDSRGGAGWRTGREVIDDLRKRR